MEVLDASGFAVKPPEPLRLWVAVQGGGVYVIASKPVEQIGLTPDQALAMARDLRTKANQLLHEAHVAEMRRRKRVKLAHKEKAHGRG